MSAPAVTANLVLIPNGGWFGIVGDQPAQSVTALSDGSAIVVMDRAIARLLPDGSPDPAFGGGGLFRYGLFSAASVTELADGKLLLGGKQVMVDAGGGAPETDSTVIRLNRDGTLDSSFGASGVVRIAMPLNQDGGFAMMQPDGKILVGAASSIDSPSVERDLVLTRLLNNGAVDTSFGVNGTATPLAGKSILKMVAQADGKVLGLAWSLTGSAARWDLVRINTDGTPDMGFGTQGQLHTVFPGTSYAEAYDLAVQPDGKIVLVGRVGTATGDRMAIARYNSDGSLDTGFGDGGTRFLNAGMSARDVALAPDGKLVVGGVNQLEGVVVARLNADGSDDAAFGAHGYVTTKYPGYEHSNLVALTVMPGGQVLTAGNIWIPLPVNGNINYSDDTGVARFLADGTPDYTFNPAPLAATLAVHGGGDAMLIAPHIRLDAPGLASRNGGVGDFNGASVYLSRHGGAYAGDLFVADGLLRFQDGHAWYEGVDIGTVRQGGGELLIDFNTAASTVRVNGALAAIAYRYEGAVPAQGQAYTLDWTFSEAGVSGGKAVMASQVALSAEGRAVPYWVDSLVNLDSDIKASKDAVLAASGQSHTWQVAFTDTGPMVQNVQNPGPLSAGRQAAVWSGLKAASDVADVHFVAGDANQANSLRFFDGGLHITNGVTVHGPGVGVDIGLNFTEGDPDVTGMLKTGSTLHEIGHALGLQHPTGDDGGTALSDAEDLGVYTVMSYNRGEFSTPSPVFNYRDLDIAALQYIYGPNHSARAGNDVYMLAQDKPNFIWDGAGVDTVSAANSTSDLVLHLSPGHWDYLGSPGTHITSAGQVTVNYGTEIENAIGGSGNDHITGNALDNRIEGGAGNDVLAGGGGDDILDGGAGTDTALFSGNRAAYTLDLKTMTVSGADGVDQLSGIERLQFDDMQVALDIDGNAGAVFRLYQAAFDRKPDAAGMGYWISALDHGATIGDVAAGMVGSKEFATLYGAQPRAEDYLTRLYAHVLHRTPDQPGLDWWLERMNSGAHTLASALQGFSDSAENRAQLVGAMEQGIAYQPWTG